MFALHTTTQLTKDNNFIIEQVLYYNHLLHHFNVLNGISSFRRRWTVRSRIIMVKITTSTLHIIILSWLMAKVYYRVLALCVFLLD